jgi:hypothetical protein
MNIFVPADHKEFGMPEMLTGTIHPAQIGYGIWKMRELIEWFEHTAKPSISRDRSLRSPEAKLLCALASYLLSDRLPYFLEE